MLLYIELPTIDNAMGGVLDVVHDLRCELFFVEHGSDIVNEAHAANYDLTGHCIVHTKT